MLSMVIFNIYRIYIDIFNGSKFLVIKIWIVNYWYKVEFENLSMVCFSCEIVGYRKEYCRMDIVSIFYIQCRLMENNSVEKEDFIISVEGTENYYGRRKSSEKLREDFFAETAGKSLEGRFQVGYKGEEEYGLWIMVQIREGGY